MTRETKIGLLVAGSFVCLVCVVVASKWKRGDDPSEEQTIKVAAVKDAPKSSESKKKEPEQKKVEEPKTPLLTVPTVPGEFRPVEAPKIDIPAPKFEIPAPKVEGPSGGIQLPMEFQLPAPKEVEVKPKEGEPKPLIVLPPEVKPVGKDPADGGFQIPPKPLQVVEDKKPLIPELPAVPAPKPFTEKEQPSFPKEGTIPAPKIEFPAPKDMVPSLPMPPAPKETPSLSVPVPLPKNPPTTPPDGTPIPKIPPKDLPTVPLTVGPMPVVRDVSTDPYVCVAGDSNFAALSRRFYGSEKYADALLAYNREHARWIKNGTALLSNPPALQPGQHIERPPVSILERSYRAWIAEPTAPKVTITPPIGIGTPGVANVGNPPSAGKGGVYRVQNPAGESVFDVAERTLGNRSLWPEIWRVNQSNPSVRPPAPIPFGTELKLP